MRVRDLVMPLEPVRVEGPLDREVSGLAFDSRRVFPGMVFVAIAGRHTDGHDHISEAIDRGACAVVCQRNGFGSRRATRIQVADTRQALARASAVFFGYPSRALRVIGITGTNGKTTVSFLIRHVLETAGIRSGLIGTVRYEIGDRSIPAQRTTPEALEIQRMMAQMVRAQCQACVLEVSSHALDQRRVDAVAFDVGVFTNLTHDHLDYHGSMEAYYLAKRRLFETLEQGAKPAAAVINIDDEQGARLDRESAAAVRVSYGLQAPARVRAVEVRLARGGTRLRVETPAGPLDCVVPLLGRINVYNVLAAVGTALHLGVSLPTLREALRTAPQVPGRLERMDRGQPFGVLVDYAHTEDALRHVLQALREITPGRILLTFGCGGERDRGKRVLMGQVAGEGADWTVVTSDNPRRESAAAIAAEVVAGLEVARGGRWQVELDRRRAIDLVIGEARAGDTVLIAGKGHETYQEYADTVVPFDDRVAALESLDRWHTGRRARRGVAPVGSAG